MIIAAAASQWNMVAFLYVNNIVRLLAQHYCHKLCSNGDTAKKNEETKRNEDLCDVLYTKTNALN